MDPLRLWLTARMAFYSMSEAMSSWAAGGEVVRISLRPDSPLRGLLVEGLGSRWVDRMDRSLGEG